jgi:hypothetical protein
MPPLLRSILAVIASYVLMAVLIVASLSVLYMAMGTDWAYQQGSFAVSVPWVLSMFAAGAVAAWLGGWVCRWISGNARSVLALALVIGVLGTVTLVLQLAGRPDELPLRAGDVPLNDAMALSIQPMYAMIVNPVLGVVCSLFGGRWFERSAQTNKSVSI